MKPIYFVDPQGNAYPSINKETEIGGDLSSVESRVNESSKEVFRSIGAKVQIDIEELPPLVSPTPTPSTSTLPTDEIIDDTTFPSTLPPSSSIDPVKLDEIKELAANAGTANESSQQILAEIMNRFNALGYTCELEANLEEENNQYKLETFQLSSEPSKVFYSIKVAYHVSATRSDGVTPDENISFTRTIYTNATNPEDALLVASKFKQTVCECALKEANKSSGSSDDEFDQHALSAQSFNFKFARNTFGDMTYLESIRVSKGGKEKDKFVERQISANHTKRYIYEGGKIRELDPQEIKLGQPAFETEEQALLRGKGVAIKQDLDELLQQEGKLELIAEELKKEMKEKQAEFDKIKKNFLQESFLQSIGLFRGPSLTKEFIQVTDDATIFQKLKNRSGIGSGAKLSPLMQQYIDANQALAKMRDELADIQYDQDRLEEASKPKDLMNLLATYVVDDMDDIDFDNRDDVFKAYKACDTAIKAKIEEAEKKQEELAQVVQQLATEIENQQKDFNQKLVGLYKINQELETRVNQLKSLQESAQKIVGSASSPDTQEKAKAFLKSISKTNIKEMGKQLNKRTHAIRKIMERLPRTDMSDSNPSLMSASDIPPMPGSE